MSEQASGGDNGERLNRLYWTGDETVDGIAGELGISRHALYKQVRPAPAGAECRECGEEMVFANRSQRAAGKARCPNCGANRTLSEEEMNAPSVGAASASAEGGSEVGVEAGGEARGRGRRWGKALDGVQPRHAAVMGGAAVAGFALATAVMGALGKRREEG